MGTVLSIHKTVFYPQNAKKNLNKYFCGNDIQEVYEPLLSIEEELLRLQKRIKSD